MNFSSAACPVCWSSSFVSLISMLPSSDYLALSRNSSEWTPPDERRQCAVTDAVVQMITETLTSTCFGVYFPQYVRMLCKPDGFNFHSQMHNDNLKCAIEYLLLVSLGLCKSLNVVYSNIMVCESRYFRVHRTTRIKGQPQSDPTLNHYTGDVVVMALSTQDVDCSLLLAESSNSDKVQTVYNLSEDSG